MKRIISLFCMFLMLAGVEAQLDRSKAPEAGVPTKINMARAKTFTLKNGLKVFVVEDHKAPLVTYSLGLDITPRYEGKKAGYSSLAGSLMSSGTSSKTKAEIDETIDFYGANMGSSSGGVYLSTLTKYSDELLELMTDILYNPSFPKEELDKVKKQMISGFAAEKEDPGTIARNIKSSILMGKKHPLGEILTEESIAAIEQEDLKAFHDTYFRPNLANLVIVGDITLKEAKAQAKKYFAHWQAKEITQKPVPFPEPLKANRVVVAHKDGSTQSLVTLAYNLDMKPGSPDELAASLMNRILGGGAFSSRLFQNLREDKAYTYGAYSSLNSDEWVGSFSASSNVRTSVTDSAFNEIIYEMNRLKEELVDEADLELIRNAMAGAFARAVEKPTTVARFATNIDKYNLPKDYYETYLERLHAVTAEDVRDMARKYLQPDRALILAVGDVPSMMESLKKFSPKAEVEIYDFYGNKVEKAPLPKGLTAEVVIENYLQAIGGKEAIEEIKDAVQKMRATMSNGMAIDMDIYVQKPNKIYLETRMGSQVIEKLTFDGESGTSENARGTHSLPKESLIAYKEEGVLFPEKFFLGDAFDLKLIGTEEVNGQQAYQLEVLLRATGSKKIVSYCAHTGLKLKQVEQQGEASVSTYYNSYTTIGGVKMCNSMKQVIGAMQLDVELLSTEVNIGIPDAKFEVSK